MMMGCTVFCNDYHCLPRLKRCVYVCGCAGVACAQDYAISTRDSTLMRDPSLTQNPEICCSHSCPCNCNCEFHGGARTVVKYSNREWN